MPVPLRGPVDREEETMKATQHISLRLDGRL
jgi:hypothetical protein